MKLPKVAIRRGSERRDDRYMLDGAKIEWLAEDGGSRTFQLLDISRRGLNFGLEPGATQLAEGMEMSEVLLHVGEREIHGRLVVTQALDSAVRGTTCGGEFHPASPDDEDGYQAIVTTLERDAAFRSMNS